MTPLAKIFSDAPVWLGLGAEAVRRAGAAALDLLYPPVCLACRCAIGAHGGLCPACWSAMRFIERPYCERLGTPFETDLGSSESGRFLSSAAVADPPVFARARAVARFEEGPARLLVHRLKYGDRGELAAPMGRWMARAGAELLDEAELLIPVPLHRLRLAHRRFNQSAALARTIAQRVRRSAQDRYPDAPQADAAAGRAARAVCARKTCRAPSRWPRKSASRSADVGSCWWTT